MGVGRFTMRPRAGAPGETLRLTLEFDQPVPDLEAVQFSLGGSPLGGPVLVDDRHLEVERTVPDISPGTYAVEVNGDAYVLAQAEFVLLEDPEGPGSGIPIAAGLVALGAVGVGWHVARIRGNSPVYAGLLRLRSGWSRLRGRWSNLGR